MTVSPGFGGQTMIFECLEKVTNLKAIKEKKGYNYYLEVDGGIHADTFAIAVKAGAEVLVTGSAFFSAPDPKEYVGKS